LRLFRGSLVNQPGETLFDKSDMPRPKARFYEFVKTYADGNGIHILQREANTFDKWIRGIVYFNSGPSTAECNEFYKVLDKKYKEYTHSIRGKGVHK